MLWLCHPNISQIRFINLLQKATCKGGFLINTLRYTSFHIANKSLYSVVLSSSTIVIDRLEKGDLVEKDILVRNMVSNLDSSRRQVKRKFIFFSETTQNYLKKSTHKKGWFLRYKPPFNFIFEPEFPTGSPVGEGRPDILIRLCMVVDWCIDHPEYTARIKVIPKKDYPILMPCEFWGIHIQAKRFELLRKYSSIGVVEA